MEKNRTMIKIISFLIVLTSAFCRAQDISVMSYNIKYANENDGENSWSKRNDFITDQIQFYEHLTAMIPELAHMFLNDLTDLPSSQLSGKDSAE